MVENRMSLAECVIVGTQCSGVWHPVTVRHTEEAETRAKVSAFVAMGAGIDKRRAAGNGEVWLPWGPAAAPP